MHLLVDKLLEHPPQDVVAPCVEYKDKNGELYVVIPRGLHLLAYSLLQQNSNPNNFTSQNPEATGMVHIAKDVDYQTGKGLEFYLGSQSTIFSKESGFDYKHCREIAQLFPEATFTYNTQYVAPQYRVKKRVTQ